MSSRPLTITDHEDAVSIGGGAGTPHARSRANSIQSGYDFDVAPGGSRRSSTAEFQERPPMNFAGSAPRRASQQGRQASRQSLGNKVG